MNILIKILIFLDETVFYYLRRPLEAIHERLVEIAIEDSD